jgi:hypothetical protein
MKTLALLMAVSTVAWAADWRVGADDGSGMRTFATLKEAVEALPTAAAEPLTLHLAAGVHRVDEALKITPEHMRGQRLTIHGGGRATISGGRQLTGWKVADGKWIIPWKDGAVRELFVNGERRPRSRFPKDGWLRIAAALPDKRSGFTTKDELPAPGPGLELLFLHDWSISRIPVASIEGDVLKTTGPIGFPAAHYAIDHYEAHPRYCLENGRSFLTEDGTWCHDPAAGELIYQLREGETPAGTTVEIPVAEKLLRIAGRVEKPVTDLRIEGVTFELCRWEMPAEGYAEGQATKHVPRGAKEKDGDPHGQWRFVPWAVEVERAEEVVFSNCTFRNLGGGGVLLGSAAKSCALDRCQVAEVSGNGIGIGEGGERRTAGKPWWQAAPEETASSNRVENCVVERCGAQFHGAVGIWVGLAKDTRIARNEIRELPYTGVSVGWMWNPTPTPCGGNLIEENHIHHVMQLLSDGGGIYTLGRQPGTLLRNNLIHDVPLNLGRAESNGMFLDEGSSEFRIEENLIHGTQRSPLRFHKAGRIEVSGNHWVLPENMPPLRFNATDPAVIEAHDNVAVDQAAMDALVSEWKSRLTISR